MSCVSLVDDERTINNVLMMTAWLRRKIQIITCLFLLQFIRISEKEKKKNYCYDILRRKPSHFDNSLSELAIIGHFRNSNRFLVSDEH